MPTKTWKDFPEFYNNETIKKLASNPLWTVSTTKVPNDSKKEKIKMPIDMHAFVELNKIWGVSFTRGWHPLVDLQTLCDILPDAINNTYFLDSRRDKIVVLDVEPTCPENLKQSFRELPFLYGEISMSGKGLHLIFELPEEILNKYPNAQKASLNDEHHYYEILMNHMVTFTRNVIPRSDNPRNIKEFENLFELLAINAQKTIVVHDKIVTDMPIEDIPKHDEILDDLKQYTYYKTLEDVENDNSAYEFGISVYYYKKLKEILSKEKYKDHDYTDEERAVLVYKTVESTIEYRPKHEQTRNKMPWLLFVASTAIKKSELWNKE